MPRKSVKHSAKPAVEEVKEEKPQILKTEEVAPAAAVTPVVEGTPVSQLAQVVEPPVKAVEPVVAPPVVPEMPVTSEAPVEKKKMSWWPLWIAVAFVLGAGAGFGLSKFNFEKKPVVKTVQNPKPTTSPTAEPTKNPEKKFDREVIKVKVLNGSGMRGKAGEMADKLTALGYKDVQTGNADRDDYSTKEVSIKDSLKTFESNIKKDLEFDGSVTTLAADDAFDVLVIIGQK